MIKYFSGKREWMIIKIIYKNILSEFDFIMEININVNVKRKE